jgi:hypothetical protein
VKSDEEVERLESLVDQFFSSLELRRYPRNLAQWMVLTRCALEVQRASAEEYGGSKHRVAVINYSRVTALLLEQIAKLGNQRFAGQKSFQWSGQLASVTHRSFQEGAGATAVGDQIRFISADSARQRQVHAFQKGILPKL